MKVIFLDNIRNVGHIGDIKDVADGYARNFLFPRGLARAADSASVSEIENLKKKLARRTELEETQAHEIAEKITDTVLELSERANPSGKLFAAVGRRELATALKTSTGYEVPEDSIQIQEHAIKALGEHTITVNLSPNVSVEVKVNILSKEG